MKKKTWIGWVQEGWESFSLEKIINNLWYRKGAAKRYFHQEDIIKIKITMEEVK